MNLPLTIVSDTCVLINFLKIDRLDLISNQSNRLIVTNHVREEISRDYSEQLSRFQWGLDQNIIEELVVSDPAELRLFARFTQLQKLGQGECSAFAVAQNRGHSVATDDNSAIKKALSIAPHLKILRTKDIIVRSIQEGILDVIEADQIKQDWAIHHQFRLPFQSFQDLL